MRRRRRLDALLVSYREHVARHSSRFAAASTSPDVRERDGGIALAAVDLLNGWNNFARAYWLSCFGSPRRGGGGRIGCTRPVVGSDPIGFAVLTFRPSARPNTRGTWDRRAEPAWHDPQTLLRLTQAAGLSNATDVAAAFSINSRAFLDLPVLRNYFAHRNESTYAAALRVAPLNSVPTAERPSQLLLAVPATSTQSLFAEWVGDLDLVADYLCS